MGRQFQRLCARGRVKGHIRMHTWSQLQYGSFRSAATGWNDYCYSLSMTCTIRKRLIDIHYVLLTEMGRLSNVLHKENGQNKVSFDYTMTYSEKDLRPHKGLSFW